MIDGHGDDAFRYGSGRIKLNFSSNICTAKHSGLKRLLGSMTDFIDSYPEPSPCRLENRIAESLGISAESVFVTAGTTEAIYTIARHFAGARSAIVVPTFAEYEDACVDSRHTIVPVLSPEEALQDGCKTDILWICNPNNPTGTVIAPERLLDMARTYQSTLFVVDEAYEDYSPGFNSLKGLDLPNLLTLHSMTKRFSVPGLRVGYTLGHPSLIDALRRHRWPWSVSAQAIEGGIYLIHNADNHRIDTDLLHREAQAIGGRLRQAGIKCSETATNFLLCCLPHGSAADLKEWLVVNHGILIRDASNFRTLSPAHFRVAAHALESDNKILTDAIIQWLGSTH